MSATRALIIGARRRNQGLGEFIARYLHEQGAEICGIVGTSQDSVEQARAHLNKEYGIEAQGFTDLDEAIERSQPNVVVIASPTEVHHQHLEAVASAGVSCLCEKPLYWDDGQPCDVPEVERLAGRFGGQGQLLELVTQAPETLDEFYTLYPEVKGKPAEQFRMLLGPAATGINMVIDSLPHVLSMVHCLTGLGEVHQPRAVVENPEHLYVYFDYRHAGGNTAVEVELVRTPKSPRPWGYAINDHAVKRSIQLPEYQMLFTGDSGEQISVADPLEKLIRRFLTDLENGKTTDQEQIIASMKDLKDIVENLHI